MTPEEVAGLLRYASSVDPWLGQTSTEEAAVMIPGWASILAPVDQGFAMDVVRAHYSEAGARTIQPGDVLTAWRAAATKARALSLVDETFAGTTLPSGLAGYLRQAVELLAAGGDLDTLPRPKGGGLSPRMEELSRECSFPDLCACSHTECRRGWLDVEEQHTSGLGQVYPLVRRCPVCADGILMAEERGLTRRRVPGRRAS